MFNNQISLIETTSYLNVLKLLLKCINFLFFYFFIIVFKIPVQSKYLAKCPPNGQTYSFM